MHQYTETRPHACRHKVGGGQEPFSLLVRRSKTHVIPGEMGLPVNHSVPTADGKLTVWWRKQMRWGNWVEAEITCSPPPYESVYLQRAICSP